MAMKYSDVKLAENPNASLPELEEWSVDKHTEESPTDAYGIVNFQGGSHSYRAKVENTRTHTHFKLGWFYCQQRTS